MIDLSPLPAGAVKRFRNGLATVVDLHHIGLLWSDHVSPTSMVDYIAEVAGTTDGLSSLLVGYAGEEMFAPIYEWHVFCYTTFVDALEAVAADPAVAEVVAAEYDVRSAEEAVAWVVTVGRELFAKEHPSEATRQLVDLYKLLESSAADTPVLPYLGTGTALMSIASVFISGPTRVDATAPLVY